MLTQVCTCIHPRKLLCTQCFYPCCIPLIGAVSTVLKNGLAGYLKESGGVEVGVSVLNSCLIVKGTCLDATGKNFIVTNLLSTQKVIYHLKEN